MPAEKNHIVYSAEDIQKYLSGKLSPAEMYAMEKAALEDEFLAEAIEGYAAMQEQDWRQALTTLKSGPAIGAQTKVISIKKSFIRPAFWRAAAAIVIIAGGVAIAYRVTNKDQIKSVATLDIKLDSTNSSVALAPAIVPEKKDAIVRSTVPGPVSRNLPPTAAEPAPTESKADDAFIYRPEKIAKTPVTKNAGGGYIDDTIKAGNELVSNNAIPAPTQNKVESYKNTSPTEQPTDNARIKKAAPLNLRRFSAQVVGTDGSPLPFANISVTKENVGTYADAKGNFRLVSGDSILNVEVKSAGYISRNFTLVLDQPQTKLFLAEDELALKENTQIVSTKTPALASAKKRKVLIAPDSVINVEPEDGWNNYDTYVINNLSVPNDIIQKNIHGEVEISFEVQRNGALTNVKIDKSLCDDCDEAALRVIKEGPRWKVKKDGPSSGKIKVKF